MKTLKFIVVLICFLGFVHSAQAAKYHFRMDKDIYKTGETGFVTINVDTETKSANAYAGTVRFDPALIEVTSISTDRTIVTMWAQSARIDVQNGKISFKGITFNPGYKGNPGRIFGINFKAKAPGKMTFTVESFNILANDGKGTSLATKIVPRSITINGPVQSKSGVRISSASHPDQKKWYSKKTASLTWSSSDKDIATISYVFDKNPKTEPGTAAVTTFSSASQRNLTSGVWYAHIRARGKTKGWFVTEHFKINVDADAPSSNTITVLPRQSEAILPVIRAKAKDALSGIAKYEVIINGKLVSSSATIDNLKLKSLKTGKNAVEIKVYDNAGNFRTDKISVLYNPLVPAKKETTTTTNPAQPKAVTPIVPTKPKAPILFD